MQTIRASGDATVQAKPDHAQLRMSVITEAPTAQAAGAANATQTDAVLKTLKGAMTPGSGEVKTSGYSLEPQYQYGQNTKPKLTGYRASNSITVDVDQLDTIGKLMDAAVQSGANEVGNLVFTLRDEQTIRQSAIAKAAAAARANAEAAAKALGLQVTGVKQVEISGGERPFPVRQMTTMLARAAETPAPTTPVEAGTIAVQATVIVTLQVQ